MWLVYALALLFSGYNRQQPSTFYDGPTTPCSCTGAGLCFTRTELNKYLDKSPAGCRACVFQACTDASIEESDLKGYRTCISNARGGCSCNMATAQMGVRLGSCRVCIAQCDRNREATCRSFCSSPTRPCPSANQLGNAIIRQPLNCRECVRSRCGLSSPSNQAEVNDCMYDALEDCRKCSFTPAARQQKRECTLCNTRCVSRPGAFETPEF